MHENYWTRRRLSRRDTLRLAGIGTAGLTGAALIGCGEDEDAPATNGAGATTAPGGGGKGGPDGAGPAGEGIPVVEGDPIPGGSFTSPATSTYLQHDPHTALGPNIWHLIGEKALEQDQRTGEVVPSLLIESFEVADDQGLELIFKVRPGIETHDIPPFSGRVFDAEDVAFNMMRIIGATAEEEGIPVASFQRASMLEGMEDAEAVDETTVRMTMSRPNSSIFAGLTENRVPMMPREMVEVGFDDPMAMGGTGPFKMVEFEPGVRMAYERFENYHQEGNPQFDRYVQQVLPDRAAQVSAFIAGEIDSIGALQAHELTTLQAARPDANYFTWVDANWMHFRPNMTYEPFADFRVRKAMQLAIDYAGMANGYWGEGWAYHAALHPNYPEGWQSDRVRALPGYNPDTKEQDRAEAVKMMDAAGFANGSGIDFETLFVEAIADTEENAIRLQSQMGEVFSGMVVNVRGYPDLASYSKPQSEGNFRGVSYIITATPDAVLEAISQFHSQGSRNYGSFNEPGLDDILDRAQAELDIDARTELLDEFQQRFMDEWLPLIVFYARPYRSMLQGRIGGFDQTAGTWLGYSTGNEIGQWYQVVE